MTSASRLSLVLVEWLDSERSDAWEYVSKVKPSALRCQSVGWLVVDDDDVKQVVPNLDAEAVQGYGAITIPACSILSMTTLNDPRADR